MPHLVEGDNSEAEIIHPLTVNHSEPDRLENRIGVAAQKAGEALLTEGQLDWAKSNCLTLVPVHRHLSKVQVIGIARLHYRPKTALTAAWWSDLQSVGERHLSRYREMVGRITAAAA